MPTPFTTSSKTTTATTAASQPAKEALAQQAITPKASSPSAESASAATPALEAIWQSFKEHGQGDTELLKLILQAKTKEDERLKAMDDLRAEQLRAQQVMWQYSMYQYMLVAAAAQQQQQQQQQGGAGLAALKGPPPYSPLSPPCELAPLGTAPSNKRPRASSNVSSASSASDASKKARTGANSPPRTLAPGQKPSHADVMEALRRKCEANKQTKPNTAAALNSARTSPSYPNRPLAPAPSVAAPARTSMSPPLAPATARRLSPPQVVPGRHTSFLRPAPPPPAASPSTSAPQVSAPNPASPPALASVHEAPAEKEQQQQASAPRNKLALLLHASESSAAQYHTPSWLPQPQAATSDVRGPIVPAPAVVAATGGGSA